MTNLQLMPHEAERNPIVFVRDGEVFANSREVATYFGKRHDDVLKAIRNLIATEPSLGLRNFAETPWVEASTGQTYRSFDMDQDGFALLAMGFTGAKALKWKLKYIEAFKAMRAQLSQPAAIDYSDPMVALGFIEHLSSQVKAKDAIIAEQQPKVDALARIESAEGSLCITDIAKVAKMQPKALFGRMSAERWIYRRIGGSWIGYQSKVQAGLLEHRERRISKPDGTEILDFQVRVTAKGLVKLAELLEQPLH